MPNGLDLNLEENLEDTLIPPGTPPDNEASLPAQQQAPVDGGQGSEGLQPEQSGSMPPALLARAQQLGLPLDGIDSTDKFTELLLNQYAQSQPYADFGRSALSQPAGQYQPGSRPEQESDNEPDEVAFDEDKHFSEAWSVPSLSPGAKFALDHGAFDTNEQGMIVPAKGLEQIALPYIKEINDYQQAKAQQNEAFIANPVRFTFEKMWPVLEHRMRAMHSELTGQRFEQFEHKNYEEKFIAENTAWLYTPDGQAFSPEGQRFKAAVADLKSRGFQGTVQELADYAMRFAGINPQAAQAPAPTQAAATNPPPSATTTTADQRQRDEHGRFIKPAGTPAPEPPKPKQESFIEEARRKAAHGASQSGRIETNDSVVGNEGELDSLWDEAWRAYSGAA
jgi:hypothetical protein